MASITQLQLAPVAIFAYNRPDRLRNLLRDLQSCDGFAQTPVTIFVDGPKGAQDLAAVEEVRHVVRTVASPNVHSVISDENRGLRQSVYAGVSRIIEEYGRIIVLEDDLQLSPIALSWFNSALDHYATDERVWSISGYIYDAPALREFSRALILPMTSSWGWATWLRAWTRFDLDARPRDENLRSPAFKQAMSINGVYPFYEVLRHSITGRLDSWAAHWSYTVFQNGGRSIFPPRRVIHNRGLSAGTHGTRLNPQELLVKRPPLLERLPKLESADEIDYFAADLLKQCWEARVQRGIVRAGVAKRWLMSKRSPNAGRKKNLGGRSSG